MFCAGRWKKKTKQRAILYSNGAQIFLSKKEAFFNEYLFCIEARLVRFLQYLNYGTIFGLLFLFIGSSLVAVL